MREVSAKAVTGVLEVLEDAGIAVEGLLADIDFPVDELRGLGARVDWDDYITFVETLEQQFGDVLPLHEIGARVLTVPSFQFLQTAAKAVISPKQLYTVANHFVAPAMFSNIKVTTEHVPTGRIIVTGEIAAGYRESEALHRLCHGNVLALPKLIDLPPSTIDEQMITGRRGRLVLVPPMSHTIVAKVRRGMRAAFSLGDAMRALMRQHTDLEDSLSALRESRQELRQLIERFPEGVLIHRGGIIVWANAAMLESLGHTLDAVVGRHMLEFLPVEDRPVLANSLASPAEEAAAARGECRVIRPDGTTRLLQAGIIQHVEFEGVMSRLVVVRDITEERRLRDRLETSERMALLGRLSAGVAHEINNPLAYAHMSIEVALREAAALGEPQRTAKLDEALVRAREGTERVRGIVRDMKLFMRPDNGGEASEAVDLAAVLDSTLALAASSIAPRARVIRRYGSAPRARGTNGRLGQLFLNLILNAVDAIPDGNPERHEIRVSIGSDSAGRAVVEISDTGVGIAPAHHAHVFDPFFTTKGVGAGTGLGLSICHGIVTHYGGEISFDSTPGRGTTFRVVLPASDAEPIVAHTPTRDHSRGRILIVDDEPELLRSLDALIGQEHDVVTASSGRQALEVLRADRGFDVILTDLMMAEVTGMDLFETVRTDYPGLEQQFVFMTGGAFTRGSRNLLASVPNRCLEKPFDADELLRTVCELVEKRGPN